MVGDQDRVAPGSPLARAILMLQEPVRLADAPIERAMTILAAPQPRRLAPLWIGAGLAAGLALLVSLPAMLRREAHPADHEVEFVLQDPASQVTLIGDFNDWNRTATPLRNRAGVWTATVTLKPGRYRYAFLIDGHRLEADPAAPAAIDEFGASTSAITVGR